MLVVVLLLVKYAKGFFANISVLLGIAAGCALAIGMPYLMPVSADTGWMCSGGRPSPWRVTRPRSTSASTGSS